MGRDGGGATTRQLGWMDGWLMRWRMRGKEFIIVMLNEILQTNKK